MTESKKPRQQRSRGDGTAYQTKDGRWRVEIVVGWTPEGKPKRKVIYGKTKTEANAKRRAAVADLAKGMLVAGKVPSLGEWLEYWLDTIAAAKIRPRTLVGYRSYVKNWITGRPIDRIALDKLTAEDLEQVYAEMRALGRSETTVSQLHRILSRALKVALQRGRVPFNAATRLDAPAPAAFSPDVLTVEDAKRLIHAASALEDGTRWMVALALGLRQGERLAVGWDRLDLEAGSLRVDRELYRLPWKHGCSAEDGKPSCGRQARSCPAKHGGGLFIGEPKSTAGKRDVPLPAEIIAPLRKHKLAQERIRIEEGERWAPFTSANGITVDLVFCQRNGKALDARKDHDAWRKFLTDAGVPEVRLHDARHTAATVLLLLGVDGRIVMEIMGWSQMSMLKRYQHVLDDMKREAAAAVGAKLWAMPAAEPAPEPAENVVAVDFAARRRSS